MSGNSGLTTKIAPPNKVIQSTGGGGVGVGTIQGEGKQKQKMQMQGSHSGCKQ